MPAPLANAAMPSISDVAVLNRRDALIVYVPAVKGAADYRARLQISSELGHARLPITDTYLGARFAKRNGKT